MRVHTKTHLIKDDSIYIRNGRELYAIPKSIAKKYLIKDGNSIPASVVFKNINQESGEAGVLLKGLRARENMTQVKFAKLIGVTQANLSKMEQGKRAIGKNIAKRIAEVFEVNYRYFLE